MVSCTAEPVMAGAVTHSDRPRFRQALVAVAVLLGLILIGRQLGGYLPAFTLWVEGLGVYGPLLFIAGYVTATVAFVPGALLTLAGGALFGVIEGTAYVFAGETTGGVLAFLLSRYALRGPFERQLADSVRFKSIERAVARDGFRIVLLLRLSPLIPFNLLNYALGLTTIKLRDYVLASFGMIPGTLLYAYYGKAVGDVAALAAGAVDPRGPAYYAVMLLGLAATAAVIALVTRLARRALQEAPDE